VEIGRINVGMHSDQGCIRRPAPDFGSRFCAPFGAHLVIGMKRYLL